MSDGWGIAGIIAVVGFVLFGVVSCSTTWNACKAAGGHPVYEYKNLQSCWDADGRRIFP